MVAVMVAVSFGWMTMMIKIVMGDDGSGGFRGGLRWWGRGRVRVREENSGDWSELVAIIKAEVVVMEVGDGGSISRWQWWWVRRGRRAKDYKKRL